MTKVQDGCHSVEAERGSRYRLHARIVRLGKDLISLDSKIVETKAPYRT